MGPAGARSCDPALAAPRFPSVPERRGHYESYYLRAVAPDRRAAVWIRYTIHKRPHAAPEGSLWCTVWGAGSPRAVKQTFTGPGAADWIEIAQSRLGPARAVGRAEAGGRGAAWSLSYEGHAGPVRHLPRRWLYDAPIPRTKTASLVSDARFSGWVQFGSERTELDRWRGMVGHNWGPQHAERWIWLHGLEFAGAPDAWLDCVVGRLRLANRLTPWVANGVLCLDGDRVRLGGLASARSTVVRERPTSAALSLSSSVGRVEVEVASPEHQTVAWIYSDPGGGQHHALHCSVATMRIALGARVLETAHGGCYELGIRETDHGVPVQPFPDG